MQRFVDSHTTLELAGAIARHLIDFRFPDELRHIAQARIWFVRSEREVFLRGHRAHAYIAQPKVQGAMSQLFEDLLAQAAGFEGEDPDFVMRFDAARWDDLEHTEPAKEFWRALHVAAGEEVTWSVGRERLVFHELHHIVQRVDKDGAPRFSEDDGRPVLGLRPHDAEFFHDELEHYGPGICGADDTAIAIAAGLANQRRRTFKVA